MPPVMEIGSSWNDEVFDLWNILVYANFQYNGAPWEVPARCWLRWKVRALCRIGTTWHSDNSSKGRTPVTWSWLHRSGAPAAPPSAGRIRRVSAGDALKLVDERMKSWGQLSCKSRRTYWRASLNWQRSGVEIMLWWSGRRLVLKLLCPFLFLQLLLPLSEIRDASQQRSCFSLTFEGPGTCDREVASNSRARDGAPKSQGSRVRLICIFSPRACLSVNFSANDDPFFFRPLSALIRPSAVDEIR